MAKNRYAGSLKAAVSTRGPLGRGGTLCRARRRTRTELTASMTPMQRIIHGKPSRGRSCWATTGYTMPPRTLPHVLIEMARDRLLEKYVATLAMTGVYARPAPRPLQTPWARNSCQYSVAADAAKAPSTWRSEPATRRALKWPASYSLPEKVPTNSRRKTCTLPAHASSDSPRPSFPA